MLLCQIGIQGMNVYHCWILVKWQSHFILSLFPSASDHPLFVNWLTIVLGVLLSTDVQNWHHGVIEGLNRWYWSKLHLRWIDFINSSSRQCLTCCILKQSKKICNSTIIHNQSMKRWWFETERMWKWAKRGLEWGTRTNHSKVAPLLSLVDPVLPSSCNFNSYFIFHRHQLFAHLGRHVYTSHIFINELYRKRSDWIVFTTWQS